MNLNMPPKQRFKKRNMLLVGFIPGPNNPKDLDSFLFPLVKELKELEKGVPYVWNGARKTYFTLKAHVCIIAADMPGREKLMNFKGNRGTSYCPYCYIHGVHNRGIYCPLNPPLNPPPSTKREVIESWKSYDAANLPMRTDEGSRKIADHVVETGDEKNAKKYGIKGPSCLAGLVAIDIPRSFPPDGMHLWWENVIPDLFRHWRGKFTHGAPVSEDSEHAPVYDADTESDPEERPASQHRRGTESAYPEENIGSQRRRSGRRAGVPSVANKRGPAEAKKFIKTNDEYNIAPNEWLRIGKDMASSAATFPASFGEPIRDFAEHCQRLKAAEWKNITLLMAPIYMKGRLPDVDYIEFLNLIDAVRLSVDNMIAEGEIPVIEQRLRRFVHYYENRYYGRSWERLSSCLPVIHQVLHVAQAIRWLGPMYVYSQWPMERVCGMIAASAKSRVCANRNMGLTMLLNEQRNHIPYVLPQNIFNMAAEAEDADGALLLHRLVAKRLTRNGPILQNSTAGGLRPPQRSGVLNRWQREALRSFFYQRFDDTAVPYITTPRDCIRWASFTSKDPANNIFTVVSSQLRRGNSTRSSSMVRYEVLSDATLFSGYCEVLFFFSINRGDMVRLMKDIDVDVGEEQNIPLYFAYIEPIEAVLEDRLLRKVGVGSKEVIEVTQIRQLIGIIKNDSKDYIITQYTSLL